jgi:flavin-binding protein dodecin
MPESVYKVIELVGTSTKSWDAAAAAAVKLASKSLRDLRVAEVTQLDLHILDGGGLVYRAKLKVSFKYNSDGGTDDDEPAPAAAAKKVKRAPKKAAPAPEPEQEDEPAPAKKAPRKKKKG